MFCNARNLRFNCHIPGTRRPAEQTPVASLYNGDWQPGEAVCSNDLVAAGTFFAYPVQENQLGIRYLHQFLEIGHIRLQESKLV